VNIEETIDIKIAALKAHKSQMRDWDPSDMVKQWSSEAAKGKEMAYAESFRVITMQDDATWEKRKAENI
jgi:LmbE family N-acetylglucosaminyl deacetylase